MKKLMAILVWLMAAAGYSMAQNATCTRLDSLFNTLYAGNRAMGSVCITAGGHVLYSNATGYCSAEQGVAVPATCNTKYRVASITKMFTAVLIIQLIQEGKMDFSTTLDDYFPNLPGAQNITIEMLLSHRSGLHNILDDPDWPNWKTAPHTQQEVLAMIARNPLDFTPGAKAAYSNSNYLLLGYIIEQVCHKPYKEVVHNRIIAKLGLKNTYYGGTTDVSHGESYSYVFDKAWNKQPEADMSLLGGAGALLSTPHDLNIFIRALYAKKLIRPLYMARMHQIADGYGMGVLPFTFNGRTAYGHNGAIDGFNALVQYFPDEDIAISFCSNGITCPVNDVVNAALTIVFEGRGALDN